MTEENIRKLKCIVKLKSVYNIGGLNCNITKLYGIIMLNYTCFNDQYEMREVFYITFYF
jgi:hypothetical protein